tara:strand:+ start:386 stop:907 length:522 start_codon:yes stop_codon:yes gene_type:complete
MRIDHIAYRVADRKKTVGFFSDALGYSVAEEFDINFDDGSCAQCVALTPPEANRITSNVKDYGNYHLAPEVFVSDGTPDSVVGKWVAERGGVGGIHHIAYCVDSVSDTMKEWKENGYAEFTTEEPLTCPGLTQCFTKPSDLTGVIYEFIERDKESKGFCKDNVKDLMESTGEL